MTPEQRRIRNKATKSEINTRIKSAQADPSLIPEAVKRLDKAVAKGIIHKNQAANRKSRLMRG